MVGITHYCLSLSDVVGLALRYHLLLLLKLCPNHLVFLLERVLLFLVD
jgi:hypothetical protein